MSKVSQVFSHPSSEKEDVTLAAIGPLREAGFALHWLHPREKRPIGDKWSEAPVASLDKLRATLRPGNNLGVRLGEVSAIAVGLDETWYLHVLDIDIRVADLADEAWEALRDLFPGIPFDEMPMVQSGSGGESRHIYLLTDRSFRSKMLAVSPGKHTRVKDGKVGWSYDWEIELYGTSKQVAMPPSIHPESGKPYIWLREFDFAALDLGVGPFLPATAIERLELIERRTFEFETREPLAFTGDQLDRTLSAINISELHYNDWLRIGQALHHQFGGSEEGFALWVEHSRRSTKFTGEKQVREMRRVKWKSFGRYRGQPVTMASIVEWAKDAQVAAFRDAFDDGDDDLETAGPVALPLTKVTPPTPANDFDHILGGDAPSPGTIDDIDQIGSSALPLAGESQALEWMSLLDIEPEKGTVRGTLHNLELIAKNDPRLAGLPQLNEFTQEPVQRNAPGTKANRRRNPAKQTRQLAGPVWQVRDPINGDLWSDDRDFAIRSILEAPKTQGGYGIKVTDRDLKAAIVLAASDWRFHPVREYLEQQAWDGIPRVERLFVDYLGAEENPYTRGVGRMMMVAAVARIYEPGHKADHVVILEGLQGKRKSTFIKVLARHWFAELDADFHDTKAIVELMQGAWIMELPELSGFGKADVRTIKAFVSRQRDKVRLAYARRAGEFPRQGIFIGSTNDKEYLKDDTGGRRWWPIECAVDRIDTDRLDGNIDQLWAEAVTLYRSMREAQPHGTLPLYLDEKEASAEALRVQESRRAESSDEILAGKIGAWLNQPIATGDITADEHPKLRNETCTAEIWCECMGYEGVPTQQFSQMIGRAMRLIPEWKYDGRFAPHGRYGKQRIWERGGREGRLARAAA